MRKFLFVSIPMFFIIGLFALPVMADNTLARFDGGVGSLPNRSPGGDGLVRPNSVFDILAGGTPWLIDDLQASVKSNGRLKLKGKGLILGGGSSVGTVGRPADNPRQVFATLFCSNDGNIQHNSGPVDVNVNGDFRIDEVLSDNVPSYACDNARLLIRSGAPNPADPLAGSWFAAGILKLKTNNGHDDD